MAFPTIATSSEGAVTTAGTSHTVTFPSGSTAGDLIFVLWGGNSSVTMNTVSDSFTTMVPSSPPAALWIGYKQIDGTEGGDLTLTSSASVRSAWIALRITGAADPAVQAPQITQGTATNTATPNPPVNTPGGAAKDYLWLVYVRQDGEEADDDTWATAPTNYSGLLQKTCGIAGAASANVSVAMASRQLNGNSEDPGTWTLAQTLIVHFGTVVIHPAPPSLAPPPPNATEFYRRVHVRL